MDNGHIQIIVMNFMYVLLYMTVKESDNGEASQNLSGETNDDQYTLSLTSGYGSSTNSKEYVQNAFHELHQFYVKECHIH